ncbi:GTP-binding protein [Didymella exigua CBS 183.55]|uniref:GTP-binding protein n=1 Tax=Didymella exigua CBS 183.55 TaxID=1150837 RepID=A0A6A5RAY9_9PLEO|nr:GTP-binding protein [Didymella exigua CBS 183.55]KAF1925405.1 GTP-binding protein [Didymella exigua CBS 183.55]
MASSSTDGEASRAATPVDPNAITTSSLKALQSADQRKVMDIVDKLRRTGLSGIVELPQLVVCGDQSSGKSSVLEAITEIPFPRKENLCTRFATEIILRRSPSATISITITPDKLRPSDEQDTLKKFRKSIDDFGQLPAIIDEATQEMGLGVVGGIGSKAFSRDVLSVEITGPDRPQLTLVDLPGLIHATNKSQTEADKELILNLVKEYMANPRTIILAVISAKNDFANQVILEHCKKIDQQNRRTLGIITKPDYLREGSDNEQSWIDLAQNKDIYLERGWHMLKNRSDDQMDFTFEQRNEAEKLFFSKGRYVHVPRDNVGINTLCERLSKLLLNHLIKELPSLKEEIASKLDATTHDIEKLGESRKTIKEQQMVLMKISMRVNDILKSATKGYYESGFFGPVNMEAAVDSSDNIRRFRAVVQHLNLAFAEDMRLRGHKYAFGRGPGDNERDAEEESKAYKELEKLELDDVVLSPKPKKLSRNEAVLWVQRTLERTRGYELPGTFQPMLISQLFWEQSLPWQEIAAEHINKVARACREFVFEVLKHTAPAEFQAALAAVNVDAALAKTLKKAKKELAKILRDKARHPSTYNHYFTDTIQKIRQRKHQKAYKDAEQASEVIVRSHGAAEYKTYADKDKLQDALNNAIEKDMDRFSAQEALDTQRAYYKDELKYFVNAVAKAVIERHLVEPLPDLILSPVTVTQMSDQEVEFVAAEPPEITQQRAHLESRRVMLEKGLDTFREAMGGLKR